MNQDELSRRDFLRLCLLSAASAGLAACQRRSAIPTLAPSPVATAGPSKLIRLTTDGDAWAWQKRVTGTLSDASQCESVLIDVNGSTFPATLTGKADAKGKPLFSAEVRLSPGENQLAAICRRPDGQEELSNMNSIQQRLRRAPKAQIDISLSNGSIVLDGNQSRPAEGGGAALASYEWTPRSTNPQPLKMQASGPRVEIAAPGADGEYYVTLQVKDAEGITDSSTTYFVVSDGKAQIPDYDREHPEWVEHAIVYGIVPRKFGDPAFQAITQRLPYLAELGVTAIWLAPINVSPAGDYGYAVKDYFELRPEFGTKDDFRALVLEAHKNGIRVLMDFVPNHSSEQHPYFVDAQEKGEGSTYWEFYDRDETGAPTHYFDWTYLPNLNYSNPEVQRFMTEAFSYWVREFDVDGFRVDACWGVKQRLPEFWPAWRKELKRIKPDLMLLAEASARDPYYFDHGFDVAYDWTDQLGKWAWEFVWTTYRNRLLAYNLDVALTNRPNGYHPDALVFRFLNNNDTGHRFISRYGAEQARVATALLLTLPGIPCIYTADELGIDFHPYMDPLPLDWEEKVPGMRDFHKRLIALRKETPALHSRLWQRLEFKATPEPVYGYVRYAGPNDPPVIVLLNFSKKEAVLEFTLPEQFLPMLANGKLCDLLTDEQIAVKPSGDLSFTLPPQTARLLAAVA